jgi:hypothetical protein
MARTLKLLCHKGLGGRRGDRGCKDCALHLSLFTRFSCLLLKPLPCNKKKKKKKKKKSQLQVEVGAPLVSGVGP